MNYTPDAELTKHLEDQAVKMPEGGYLLDDAEWRDTWNNYRVSHPRETQPELEQRVAYFLIWKHYGVPQNSTQRGIDLTNSSRVQAMHEATKRIKAETLPALQFAVVAGLAGVQSAVNETVPKLDDILGKIQAQGEEAERRNDRWRMAVSDTLEHWDGAASSFAAKAKKAVIAVLVMLGLLLAAVIALGVLSLRAHAQIDVLKWSGNGITGTKTYGGPFTISLGTNLSGSVSGSTITLSASATAATAWSGITAATNANLGTFAMSGNTLDLTLATMVKLRVAGGLTTSANGDCGYDSTAKVWHCWQNGADRLMIMATNLGASGQPLMSNADGSGTFADPIVSGATAIAAAPATNPVFVGTWDGTNIRVPLTQNGTPGASDYGLTVRNIPTGTQAVSGTFWQATQPVSGTFWQATQPVSGTFWQATQPVSTADGSQVTLGAKADAKSTATDTTAITIMSVLKQISASVQAPPTQAVTQSGTWSDRMQDGAGNALTTNSSTYTAKFALDFNLLGTLGTAFSTAGKVDVKSADGDIATLGLKTDAAATQTDTTSVSVVSILKEISAKAQAPAALPANQSVNLAQIAGSTAVADPCKVNAKTYDSFSLTANTQLITGTSAKKIYFCSFSIVVGAANNVAIVEGTGTVCATGIAKFPGLSGGTTAATGWNLAANGGLTYGSGEAAIAGETTNADNVCILVSAAVQTSGGYSYVVQ